MHHLLSIIEIVDHIAGFADKQTLARAAAVNFLSSTICLDRLWHELQSFKPLIQILPPLEHAQANEPPVPVRMYQKIRFYCSTLTVSTDRSSSIRCQCFASMAAFLLIQPPSSYSQIRFTIHASHTPEHQHIRSSRRLPLSQSQAPGVVFKFQTST